MFGPVCRIGGFAGIALASRERLKQRIDSLEKRIARRSNGRGNGHRNALP